MKVKSESEVAQPCPTLSDPMDCSLPGSSVHGILQATVLQWGAIDNMRSYQEKAEKERIEGKMKERRKGRDSLGCTVETNTTL